MGTTAEAHLAAFREMPPEEQMVALKTQLAAAAKPADAVAAARSVLPPVSSKISDPLWIAIFSFLGAVVIAGAVGGAVAGGSTATALFGFAGTALGAVVGVLSPSPAAASGNGK